MTKVAIVSDVHLKLRRHKEFEQKRFDLLIGQLAKSDADVIIFNGDLLDYARPTLEEIQAIHFAFSTLKHHKKTIYVLGGNHEAVTKHLSTYDFLCLYGVELPRSLSPYIGFDGVTIQLCYWNKLNRLPELDDADILITHYRSAMEGLYDEEVETANFVNKYKLVLLGDIHSRYSPLPHVFYTGSPYSIASIRNSTEKFGYVELTLDDGEFSWKYIDLNLPQKVRIDMSYDRLEEFEPDPRHLYTIHITGTLEQLNKVSDYDLVTFKKFVVFDEPEPATTKVKQELSFVDALVEKVEDQLEDTTNRKEARNIIIQLQGDS